MQVRAVELANVDIVWGLRGLRERGSQLRRFVTGVEDSGGGSGLSLLVGRAEYDEDFDLTDPAAQIWILSACANLTRNAQLGVREGGVLCPLADLDAWLAGLGNRFGGARVPIADADTLGMLLVEFLSVMGEQYDDFVGVDCVTQRAIWIAARFVTTLDGDAGAVYVRPHYEAWRSALHAINAAAPPSAARSLASCSTWVKAYTEILVVKSMYQACAVAFACAFVALALFTRSARLAALATSTVLAIVLVLFGFMVGVMQWHFGAIEAVSMIIFIGYAVDYTMHIAQIFHRTHDDLTPRRAGVLCSLAACTSALSVDATQRRGRRLRETMLETGAAIVSAATTTTLSSVFLLCCTIIVFNRMGIIVCVATVASLIYSLGGFSALLVAVGPPPHQPGTNGCRAALGFTEPPHEPQANRRIVAVASAVPLAPASDVEMTKFNRHSAPVDMVETDPSSRKLAADGAPQASWEGTAPTSRRGFSL